MLAPTWIKMMNLRISGSVFIWTVLSLPIVISCSDNTCDNNRNPALEKPFNVTINVENNIVYVNQTVTFIAFATDADRDTISYKWKAMFSNDDVSEIVFKPIVNTNQRIQFTANTQGIYLIEVIADDGCGGIDRDMLQISVISPPVARYKQLSIIEPQNGDRVNMDVDVKGTYCEIPEDKWIAVYTHKHEHDKWISQPNVIVLSNGLWLVHAKIGEQNDNGMKFDIGVKFIDKNGIIESIEYPGFHDIITVIRE